MRHVSLGLLLLLLIGITALAKETPLQLPFWGYLTEQNGGPITGSKDLLFELYDAAEDGNLLWSEVQNGVVINEGSLTTTLGAVSTLEDQLFGKTELWLNIIINPNSSEAETLSPRTRIYAANAEQLAREIETGREPGGSLDDFPVNDNLVVDSTIAGGVLTGTVASGRWSLAIGDNCTASGYASSVAGGGYNLASDSYTAVAGGYDNEASDAYCGVGGGYGNVANSGYSYIGGGYLNNAAGFRSVVGGGAANNVSIDYSTIAGGVSNTVSGGAGMIGGGAFNRVRGGYSIVGGGGGGTIADSNSVVGDWSVISGGSRNYASADCTAICGGTRNTASGVSSFIGGGLGNNATAVTSSVGGGWANNANGAYSTIGGGYINQAQGTYSALGGGYQNTASGAYSFVGGGYFHSANGTYATLPGGYNCDADGNYSFATGRGAEANHDGSFVWGDSYAGGNVVSSANNQVTFRASGGYRIFTNTALTTGVAVAAGGGAWASISDRNKKENFKSINTSEILDKVDELPILQWNYKSQDKSIQHVGPMAQDFYAAFKLGDDDKTICTIDPDGIALAAIQELSKRIREQDAEIAKLTEMVETLAARDESVQKARFSAYVPVKAAEGH